MKQIVIPQAGDTSVFQIIDKETPSLPREHVLVKVKAAGINFADILARQGMYPDAPPFPCVVGYEVSGVVIALGEGCNPLLEGQEIVALTRFGGYSDEVVIPEKNILFKPNNLSFEETAAIPVNYLTAYMLIEVMGSLHKNEVILVHNAGGGVGLAALDFIKHIGAKAIGTASKGKHEFLKERGYDHLIDYRSQDWFKEVMKYTDNKGVELILDPLGGQNWKKSYAALRASGRLGIFGVSTVTESQFGKLFGFAKMAVQMPWFNPIALMNSNKGAFGVNLGHLWKEGPKVRNWMHVILNSVKDGWIKPYVDKSFPFSQVGDAHQYIEDRKNIGKIVLIPDE